MRHFDIPAGGIKIHAVEHGDGPVILFCHGFPSLWSMWRAQMVAVAAAGWRAVAIDMRGYGLSGAPEAAEAYTPFDTVGDLIAVLDHLGVETAPVIGHDFGASVAWNAAMLRPDRFSAVAAISVPYRPLGGAGFLADLRSAGMSNFYMFDLIKREADLQWQNAAVTLPGLHYWSSAQAPDETRWHPFDPGRGLLRPAPQHIDWIDPEYMKDLIDVFARTGFHGGLNYYRALDTYFAIASRAFAGRVIGQPSFFITGAVDGLNDLWPQDAEALRSFVPSLRSILTVSDAGHWPHLEKPAVVNEALVSFLSSL
ncbi:alpha/beta fold hydrolase [Sphingomonas arantia]|uniref:Alpha/beta fold hydrolase n=1 Tax=Sphingomonas arantia TaxID=1460676 RepID=A0ABW4TXW6_9SPHN